VLVLTMHTDSHYALRARQTGASGVVSGIAVCCSREAAEPVQRARPALSFSVICHYGHETCFGTAPRAMPPECGTDHTAGIGEAPQPRRCLPPGQGTPNRV
jgi:hypothetical protein